MTRYIFAATLVACASIARADEVDRGRELALRWCVNCHIVAADAAGGDAGPPFAALSGLSRDRLRNWLSEPHPPMPDLHLAAAEFDDLAAYILSLQP